MMKDQYCQCQRQKCNPTFPRCVYSVTRLLLGFPPLWVYSQNKVGENGDILLNIRETVSNTATFSISRQQEIAYIIDY